MKRLLSIVFHLLLLTSAWNHNINAQYPIEISTNDSIVDISFQTELYVDNPPFKQPGVILSGDFFPYRNIDFHDSIFHRSNQIFWYRFEIKNTSQTQALKGNLYFGIADRLMAYQYRGDDIDHVGHFGFLYKNRVTPERPHHLLIPVAIQAQETKKYLVQMSSVSYFFNNDRYCTIRYVPEHLKHPVVERPKSDFYQGMFLLGIIMLMLFLGIFSVFCFGIIKDKSLFAFSLICIFSALNYSRELEFYFDQIIFFLHWDNLMFALVFSGKAAIAIAFYIFAYYKFRPAFDSNKALFPSQLMGSLAIVISAVLNFYIVDPYASLEPVQTWIYIFDGFNTLFNLYLFITIWRSKLPYSKLIMAACLFYLLIGYSGFYLHGNNPSLVTTFISYRFLSLYGLLLFIGTLGYITFVSASTQYKLLLTKSVKANNLLELNKAKSNLYANISHEFRTPLTIIKSATESISGFEKQKSAIDDQSSNLLDLVDEMLDLAKSDTGKMDESNTTTGDIVKYLSYLNESFSSLAQSKNIDLRLSTSIAELHMLFSENTIKQIATNLLSNAIKYTPEYGTITTHLEVTDNHLHWKIKDTGRGIDSKHQDEIFDKYYRINNSDAELGTGIGLSIVKQLVQSLDGTIRVESVLGHGSEFTIIFPIRPARQFTYTVPTSTPSNSDSHAIRTLPLPNVKNEDEVILIVEDNPEVLKYISKCLPSTYKQLIAHNGQQGLDLASQHIPDLIISDIMMPIMDGYELIRKLKLDFKTSHIPTILLTAKAGQDAIEEGLQSGANAYLIKPFSKSELTIRINNLIQERKNLQSYYAKYSPNNRKQIDPWLSQFTIDIESNLEESNSIEDLAKRAYMSRSQLHRKIKALTGLSPSQYIKSIKLNKAKTLLESQKLSIGVVAIQCGYKTTAHFSRDFKQQFGHNPSALLQ